MKIVIAPDSFKESLDARSVAIAIHNGLLLELPDLETDIVPMADGGEGTIMALITAADGRVVDARALGPLGKAITSRYGLMDDGKSAVVEMASICGLGMVPTAQRNPMLTTSYGCGELIRDALDNGAERIIVAIGGSATNDGGLGMLQALGVRFADHHGKPIEQPVTGAMLEAVARVDVQQFDARIHQTEFTVACDVTNPLLGPRGATYTFGPQKGASDVDLKRLEQGLDNAYGVIEQALGKVVRNKPGAGAAGGIGAALLAFFKADLRPGIEVVAQAQRLQERIRGADLVITGEGAIDGQTVQGKTPIGVARIAAAAGVPVVAVGGMLADDAGLVFAHGIDALEAAVTRPIAAENALRAAEENLQRAGQRVGRWIKLAKRLEHV